MSTIQRCGDLRLMYYVGLALEVIGIFLGISSLGLFEAANEAVGALFLAGAALFVAGYLMVRGCR